jgi:catechol 2,3-dioxygenase-like lactoylglutathione lyase family enzyme
VTDGCIGIACSEALLTLATPDQELLVQFYQRLLGFEPHIHRPQVYAEFQLPGLRLGIFRPADHQSLEFELQSSASMSLCLEVGDLAVAIATLSALGYPPPGSIMTASHGQEIYAYDPAGNRLILHQSAFFTT